VTGARGCQLAFRVARIGDRVMDDVSEELGSRQPPAVARDVAGQCPEPFARRDQQARLAQRKRTRRGCRSSHHGLPKNELPGMRMPRREGMNATPRRIAGQARVEINGRDCDADGERSTLSNRMAFPHISRSAYDDQGR
jgi:hypothetical protein